MIIKRKVGPKGQVVIPKDIRDLLHIQPGSEILIEILDKEIIIRPSVDPEVYLKQFCTTPKKLKEKINYKDLYDQQYTKV
ncbi:MAG TPA: AbrB/MazE/SpoVT family DNA-binding domain-containing protein [Candidatus Lokiarchaeia archaeon]